MLFAVNQRIDVIGRQLKSMPMRDRIGRTSFHAIPAKNTARIINIVDAGIPFARGDAIHVGVFRGLDINAVRWACRGAQKAPDALLQTAFIAMQHVNAAVARLKMYLLVGIIFCDGFAEYISKRNAEALRQRAKRFGYFPKA